MLNFAVIGVGRMGKRHAFNLKAGLLFGVRLAAVCDVDDKALDWCKKHLKGVKAFRSYKDLANEKLDGVIIATPHYQHVEIAKFMIEAGINTLIEKPAAPNVTLIKEIESAHAKRKDVLAGVSYNQRSNRMYKRAKALLSSGKLGEIQRANYIITDWFRSQAYYDQGGWRATYGGEGGGCLMNQCIHQLDVLQWLIGMPKSVVATTRTVDRNISVENDVSAILVYDKFDCSFTASTHEIKGVNRLEIACDKGRLVIGPRRMRVYRHKSEVEVNAKTKFGYGSSPSVSYFVGYGFFRYIADLVKGQQLRSLRAFRDAINKKGSMLAELEEGERAMQIINGIYLSSYLGESVSLPVDEQKYGEYLEKMIEKESKN